MFKKTVIAAALAATSLTAAASTVSVTGTTEGVIYAQQTKVKQLNDITIDIGRDYNDGDVIVLTVSGAAVAQKDGTTTLANPSIGNDDVDFLSFNGDNEVRFLVTDDVAASEDLVISGVYVDVSGAADKGKVKLTAKGIVLAAGVPTDVDETKTADAATAITFANEFNGAVSGKLDGVVDVNESRQKFVGGSTADQLVLTNTVTTTNTALTGAAATYTIKGDFSFLDVDGDGELEAKEGTFAAVKGSDSDAFGTVTFADDMQSVTIVDDAAFASGTVGFTITGAAKNIIPAQEYKVSQSVAFDKPGATSKLSTALLTDANAGSWTLNGANVHVPFLPFDSQYAQSVTITNTSSQAGSVDLVLYANGETVEVAAVATAAKKGITNISAEVASAVATAGLSGNVAFDVIVNAPTNAVSVSAIYYSKADADRVKVK